MPFQCRQLHHSQDLDRRMQSALGARALGWIAMAEEGSRCNPNWAFYPYSSSHGENVPFTVFEMRLMWAFDFDRAIDPQTGKEIVPDRLDLIGGLLVQPAPFKMNITPRSEKRAQMVREAWRECQETKLDDELQWKSMPNEMYRMFPSMSEVKA